MKGNGDIKKYFDALNKRFDALEDRFDALEGRFDTLEGRFDTLEKPFDSLEKRFDSLEKRFDAQDKRFDALTAEVGDIKLKVESLNMLTTDMLRVQQIIIKDIADVKIRVERLEDGQKRIIVLLTKLGKRVSDFDSGEKLELSEVRYDEASHTLTGTIREHKPQYRARKRKQKR